jgi:hypothetical protein
LSPGELFLIALVAGLLAAGIFGYTVGLRRARPAAGELPEGTEVAEPPTEWFVHLAGMGEIRVAAPGLRDVDRTLAHLRKYYPPANELPVLGVTPAP